jgi:hypothetical protein
MIGELVPYPLEDPVKMPNFYGLLEPESYEMLLEGHRFGLKFEDLEIKKLLEKFDKPLALIKQIVSEKCIYSFHLDTPTFDSDLYPPNITQLSLKMSRFNWIVKGEVTAFDVKTRIVEFECKNESFQKNVADGKRFNIEFWPNRINFIINLNTINCLINSRKADYFWRFQPPSEVQKPKTEIVIADFEWIEKRVADNEEQKSAIHKIINCTSGPVPLYI